VSKRFDRRAGPTSAAAEYGRAKVSAGRTPWRQAHYCVVDLELSGLDPERDEIISFAAVPIDAGRVVAGNAVYRLCRNSRPLPERSILIHGIRSIDIESAPPLDEVVADLLTVMTGRILVAHFASVEVSFLTPVLQRLGAKLHRPVLDTRDLAYLLGVERRSPLPTTSLSDLAHSLMLPVHRPHHALGDALTTAQVFIALSTHLERYLQPTVRSLAGARRRARDLSIYAAGPD
jgi:DNA polymerase-3 subunit epsilon